MVMNRGGNELKKMKLNAKGEAQEVYLRRKSSWWDIAVLTGEDIRAE